MEPGESKQFIRLTSVRPSFDEAGNVWIPLGEAASDKSRAFLLNVYSEKGGEIIINSFDIFRNVNLR